MVWRYSAVTTDAASFTGRFKSWPALLLLQPSSWSSRAHLSVSVLSRRYYPPSGLQWWAAWDALLPLLRLQVPPPVRVPDVHLPLICISNKAPHSWSFWMSLCNSRCTGPHAPTPQGRTAYEEGQPPITDSVSLLITICVLFLNSERYTTLRLSHRHTHPPTPVMGNVNAVKEIHGKFRFWPEFYFSCNLHSE